MKQTERESDVATGSQNPEIMANLFWAGTVPQPRGFVVTIQELTASAHTAESPQACPIPINWIVSA